MASVGRGVRRHIIAGLVVIAPVGVTAFVLWWIFQSLDGLLGRFLYPAIGVEVPGLGVLVLILLLLVVGWVAQRTIGSRLVAQWHTLLERFPLTSRIYIASNRIVRTLLGEDRRVFRDVVLVEYPAPGRWSIGFLTAEAPDIVAAHVDDAVTVFIPTTPSPVTGFLTIVPRRLVVVVDMTLEEAFTFILSVGTVTQESEAPGVLRASGGGAGQ